MLPLLPATREAEVSWSREESERRDRGAMVTQTMSQVSRCHACPGHQGSRVTGPRDYNAELIGRRRPAALLTLWFVSSIGSSLVNIVNSSHSFVTFYPSLVMIRWASRYRAAQEISLHFHLNLSETTLNNVSESAALKLASKHRKQ